MIEGCVKNYLEFIQKEREFSKNTLDAYVRDLNNFKIFLKDNDLDNLSKVNRPIVIKYLISLKESGRANSTISRNLASIRSLFQYLLFQNIVKEDPTYNLKSYPTERKTPDTLSIEELESILEKPNADNIKGARDKAMIHLISSTGLRVSQMIGLNIRDIDFEAGTIYVKDGKSRVIRLDDETIKVIKNYLAFIEDYAEDSPLFVNMYGDRLSRQGFWKILRAYAKKAGIKKNVTPHTLRHTCAINMINKGVSLSEVQKILGHSDRSTTEIYISE